MDLFNGLTLVGGILLNTFFMDLFNGLTLVGGVLLNTFFMNLFNGLTLVDVLLNKDWCIKQCLSCTKEVSTYQNNPFPEYNRKDGQEQTTPL